MVKSVKSWLKIDLIASQSRREWRLDQNWLDFVTKTEFTKESKKAKKIFQWKLTSEIFVEYPVPVNLRKWICWLNCKNLHKSLQNTRASSQLPNWNWGWGVKISRLQGTVNWLWIVSSCRFFQNPRNSKNVRNWKRLL